MAILLFAFGAIVLLRSRLAWHATVALTTALMLEPLVRLWFGVRSVIRTRHTDFSWFNQLTLFVSPLAATFGELLILLVIFLLLMHPPVKSLVATAAAE